MKHIVLALLIASIISPAFAETKRTKALVQIKHHSSSILMTPLSVTPNFPNENWDQTFDKPKDQNTGG
jgi:hypothetical protein